MDQKINGKNAFSLMELMVVLTIMSILAAAGIPSYVKYIQRAAIIEAISVLGDYETSLGVFWNTEGTLPASGSTLQSTPANLPFGALVTYNLPSSIESIELTNGGNGVVVNVVVQSNVFSTYSQANRTVSLGAQPIPDTGEIAFVCGNYTPNAQGGGDQGFTDISVLPQGCNYNGVQTWLATTPTANFLNPTPTPPSVAP